MTGSGGTTAHERVVRDWHDAVNRGDTAWLRSLVTDDVEIGGPRGSARGAGVMSEWAERSGIHLVPGRVVQRDDVVVVEQEASWRVPESGERGESRTVATIFEVDRDRIRRVVRLESLDEALAVAGFDSDDVPR